MRNIIFCFAICFQLVFSVEFQKKISWRNKLKTNPVEHKNGDLNKLKTNPIEHKNGDLKAIHSPWLEQGSKLCEEERLQKVIARAGISSRRNAEKIISDGRVIVNGKK